MKPLINTHEFLSLSSTLNYQLAGEPVNWRGILTFLMETEIGNDAESSLLQALEYLDEAYGKQKRRLGPLAVLHPIRAASLIAKAYKKPDMLNLLTALLHDKDEDLIESRYSSKAWQSLELRFQNLYADMDEQISRSLIERIALLAKEKGERYTLYLGRLLKEAKKTPELASIKLADRLDNTLDLRIDLYDITDNSHSFQVVFDILFANAYSGLVPKNPHPVSRKINGAMRLYQLYKNSVLLSIVRDEDIALDLAGKRLFYSLAIASIRESQTIMLHIFSYHLKEPAEQRALLLEAMDYSHRGGFEFINEAGDHALDGFFRKYFVHDNSKEKKRDLNTLYENKRLIGLAAISFLIIFANFINSDSYVIRGITSDGIIPQ